MSRRIFPSKALIHSLDHLFFHDRFVRSPQLVSMVIRKNILPVARILEITALKKHNIAATDIEFAMHSSPVSKLFLNMVENELALPFYVYPEKLIFDLRTIQHGEELEDFIASLYGQKDFKIENNQERNTKTIEFQNANDSFAVWRALSFVPFYDQILTPTVYSVPVRDNNTTNTSNNNKRQQISPRLSPVSRKRGVTQLSTKNKSKRWNKNRPPQSRNKQRYQNPQDQGPILTEEDFPSFSSLSKK